MDFAVLEASILGRTRFISLPKPPVLIKINSCCRIAGRFRPRTPLLSLRVAKNCGRVGRADFSSHRDLDVLGGWVVSGGREVGRGSIEESDFEVFRVFARRGLLLALVVCGVFLIGGCRRVLAMEGVLDAGVRVFEKGGVLFKGAWPKMLLVLKVLREQGLVLTALLGLSAFFSMAETSITTLWPWKVHFLSSQV